MVDKTSICRRALSINCELSVVESSQTLPSVVDGNQRALLARECFGGRNDATTKNGERNDEMRSDGDGERDLLSKRSTVILSWTIVDASWAS
jgi:hypothetical protein